MLIDHASSILASLGNLKCGERRILRLLTCIIVSMFLLSLSCLNLKLYRELKPEESRHPAFYIPKTIESRIQVLPERKIEKKILSVSPGDTFLELLLRERLDWTTETVDEDDLSFLRLNLRPGVNRAVEVTQPPEKGFVAEEILNLLNASPVQVKAEIKSSLYNAAIGAGMPTEILIQMIKAYSYDVDFQRDIHPGDMFEAIFEENVDENGNYIRGGSVLYASIKLSGRTLPIYRYKTTDGEVDFFNEMGRSVRKTLMITPINGAKLSSGYGMRRHPIKGYSRMHKGLDFAAPTGTPVMAAGVGSVEYAGLKGGYGNCIRIRHANEFETVFAHLSKFASGIKTGTRVKQGQIIGYVGSTGDSTGPHLHYEILHRGKSINPASIKTMPGRILKGEELERFYMAKGYLERLYASMEKEEKYASLN